MKREEKNVLSRQRIVEAALREFSTKGYSGASLNSACAENGISKGIVYHYFQDKDEIYLLCVKHCFDELTAYLKALMDENTAACEQKMAAYFGARFRFFAEHPLYLGLFADVTCNPPPALIDKIAACREAFDKLNLGMVTEFLSSQPLREGFGIAEVAEDFQLYMDFFNLRFRQAACAAASMEETLREHEKQCHRQLTIWLHGVLEERV